MLAKFLYIVITNLNSSVQSSHLFSSPGVIYMVELFHGSHFLKPFVVYIIEGADSCPALYCHIKKHTVIIVTGIGSSIHLKDLQIDAHDQFRAVYHRVNRL